MERDGVGVSLEKSETTTSTVMIQNIKFISLSHTHIHTHIIRSFVVGFIITTLVALTLSCYS